MIVEAVVTRFDNGIGCNIGNRLFADFDCLRDIFQVRPCAERQQLTDDTLDTSTPPIVQRDVIIDSNGHADRSTGVADKQIGTYDAGAQAYPTPGGADPVNSFNGPDSTEFDNVHNMTADRHNIIDRRRETTAANNNN